MMNEKQLCKFIEDWTVNHYPVWLDFRRSVRECRRTGIYLIEGGNQLLDIIEDILGNIEYYFDVLPNQHIIPARLSSPHQLIRCLHGLRDYAKQQMEFVNKIPAKYQSRYEVRDVYEMLEHVYEMADYCIQSYKVEIVDDTYMKPYLDMKACLDSENMDEFTKILIAVYKNIPYEIQSEKLSEAYFHSIAHALMYQLGFQICSEKALCDGRLDMKIEMEKRVYIFEFKYSMQDDDMCDEAIQQIKDKQYADPYLLMKKRVIAVGVTFGQQKRNIINCKKIVLENK